MNQRLQKALGDEFRKRQTSACSPAKGRARRRKPYRFQDLSEKSNYDNQQARLAYTEHQLLENEQALPLLLLLFPQVE